VKSVGDRALARHISKLSRPWNARPGEVFALERRAEVRPNDIVHFSATEIGYWKKGRDDQADMLVSVFDLPTEELKRVSPLVVLSMEDNRHAELLSQHIRYFDESRRDERGEDREGSFVCLSFWGGMLIIETAPFEDFCPGDHLVPVLSGGFGFGFIWREVSRAAVPDAYHDADILLGKFIGDRLYPGLPEPVPAARNFGVVVEIDDQLVS
jgi:hypothetical protein